MPYDGTSIAAPRRRKGWEGQYVRGSAGRILRLLAFSNRLVRRATTVLVVEDDAAIRTMIVEALKMEGYDPTAVSNTPTALEHIRAHRPDLIITDYHLPGADGLELLRSLQAEGFGDVPALVISADVRPPDLPVTSFIPKPFELEAILRAVRRVLGKRTEDPDQRTQSRAPGRLGWASLLAKPQPEMALA